MREYVEKYKEQGLCFIPILFKSKNPAIKSWKEYQKRKPTQEEIALWFNDLKNIAIICGSISNNLVVLDFDVGNNFNEQEFFEEWNKIMSVDIRKITKVVRTSKGVHIYFLGDKPLKTATQIDVQIGKISAKLDIKAEGGYVVAPPSVHPGGGEYKDIGAEHIKTVQNIEDMIEFILNKLKANVKCLEKDKTNRLDKIDYKLNEEEWEKLKEKAKKHLQFRKCLYRLFLDGVGEGNRNNTVWLFASFLKDVGWNKEEVLILLLNWNIKKGINLPEKEIISTVNSCYENNYHINCSTIRGIISSLLDKDECKKCREKRYGLSTEKHLDWIYCFVEEKKSRKCIAKYRLPVYFAKIHRFDLEKERIIHINRIQLEIEDHENHGEIKKIEFGENAFDTFMEHTRTVHSTTSANYVTHFEKIFEMIKEEAIQIEEWRTNCYGVFDLELIITPRRFKYDLEIHSHMVEKFIETFSKEYDENELYEVFRQLGVYLDEDDISKSIFEFALASIFRYPILKDGKLSIVPNLIIIGEKGKGKTSRCALLISAMLFGDRNTSYTSSILSGTGIRLEGENWVALPLWIDEMKEIKGEIVNLLKQVGTNKKAFSIKYTASQKAVKRMLIRNLVLTVNEMKIEDEALLDRCLVINIDHQNIKGFSEEKRKAYKYLLNKIWMIPQYIYENISKFKKFYEELNGGINRKEDKEKFVEFGKILATKLFEEFGMTYKPSKIKFDTNLIVTKADEIKEHIFEELRKIFSTKYTEYLWRCDTHIELSKIGIYIKQDHENKYIIVTSKGIEHLKIKTKYGIKTCEQLSKIFETENKVHKVTIYNEKDDVTFDKTIRGVAIPIEDN